MANVAGIQSSTDWRLHVRDSTYTQKLKWWQFVVLLALLPLLAVVLLSALLFMILAGISLRIAVWCWWCLRGRDVLFVYSDSPHWRDYIEQQILPQLGDRAVVLNWSERKRWRFSLARLVFRHFGGYREFNPLGVVFRPLGPTRTFRFWQPFRDHVHGHLEPLQRMEAEFFRSIGIRRNSSIN
jgi:hypothetical protein